MEKLKFKNGKVIVATDIYEVVKLTIDNCKENTSEQKKLIEKYLLEKKPDKCVVLTEKGKCGIIYRYVEENGEKCYDVYKNRDYFDGYCYKQFEDEFEKQGADKNVHISNVAGDDTRIHNILKALS